MDLGIFSEVTVEFSEEEGGTFGNVRSFFSEVTEEFAQRERAKTTRS